MRRLLLVGGIFVGGTLFGMIVSAWVAYGFLDATRVPRSPPGRST